MNYDIIVVGGGPSGMMAAISAASKGKRTALLEHNDRVGKKILATGNGKCNLTNIKMTPDCYNSDSGISFFDVINRFTPDDLIHFLAANGLYTVNKNGYIYPASQQSATVLDFFRVMLKKFKVDVFTDIHITSIKKQGSFTINTSKEVFTAPRLIISCGSKSASKTGSDGSGYNISESFKHTIIKPVPALVQIKCREKFFKELHGIRCDAEISFSDGSNHLIERGELQLTEYGISGIPVFQLSRHIKRAIDSGKRTSVTINFLPDYTVSEVKEMLNNIFASCGTIKAVDSLNGLFNKKLCSVFIKQAGIPVSELSSDINEEKKKKLLQLITEFSCTPVDTNGFENSQVTAGGINLKEINLNKMESKIVEGLYFSGEILDVDGICGGYNLQWAFSSGRLAGLSASEK